MKKVKNEIEATASNILFYKDKLWFTEKNCNELYYHDLAKQKTVFFSKFYDEKEYRGDLFGGIIPYKDYLFLIPAAAKYLYRVNLTNRKIKKISLDFAELHANKNIAKFVSAHIVGEKLYLIGAACPVIVEYNCENDKILFITEPLNFLRKDNIFNTSIFVRKTLLLDGKIYIPLCRKNYVGIFDPLKYEITYYCVGSKRSGYSAICGKNGNEFWLSPRNKGPVVYWNKNEEKWEEIEFPSESIPLERGFADALLWKNKVLLFPLKTGNVWEIDCAQGQLELSKDILNKENMMHVCISDGNLYCFSANRNQFCIIKEEYDSEIKYFSIFLPQANTKHHLKNNYEMKILSEFYQNEEYYNNYKFVEGKNTKLEYYLFWIKEQINNNRNENINNTGGIIFSLLV